MRAPIFFMFAISFATGCGPSDEEQQFEEDPLSASCSAAGGMCLSIFVSPSVDNPCPGELGSPIVQSCGEQTFRVCCPRPKRAPVLRAAGGPDLNMPAALSPFVDDNRLLDHHRAWHLS